MEKLVLATILAGSMVVGNNAFAATTYDYADGEWQEKDAAPHYQFDYAGEDITDWAVPVFDKKGKQVFEVLYIPKDKMLLGEEKYTSSYEMIKDGASPLINQAMVVATKYWADVINTKNAEPVQVIVSSANGYGNANATTWSFVGTGEEPDRIDDFIIADVIQNNRKFFPVTSIEEESAATPAKGEYSTMALVQIGDYLGSQEWDVEKGLYGMRIDLENLSHLPSSEGGMDLIATLNHEMTHSLGIAFNGDEALGSDEKPLTDIAVEYTNGKENQYNNIYKFGETLNAWEAHLMDQNGNMAKPGQYIAPSATVEKMINDSDGKLTKDNFFVMDNIEIFNRDDDDGEKQPHANTPFAGKVFFVGDNVSKLLNSAEDFKTPISGVYGVSVNTWEKEDDTDNYNPELSHTSLPILMSHNQYRNYATNTELELAIMKDMGYDIDIRNQYGRSVYGSNLNITNEDVYFARNDEGTAYVANAYNNAYYGVGLHVFGSNNNITQKGNILTNGLGAIGVRIDGVGNTTTIAKETQVRADGINGIGILQSYGNNHKLNVEGIVTAAHETGNAVRFDFGANMLGAKGEYRGSYIRYFRVSNDNDGTLTQGTNISFDEILNSLDGDAQELNGTLVTDFNLSGSINGGKNAIYIGKNAFVENINVLDGASIVGDITSDWKDFAPKDDVARTNYCFNIGNPEEGYVATERIEDEEPVENESIRLQYKGKEYEYDSYIPDLVTNLNINSDFAYNSNITGKNNMRLNVNSGTFAYGGSADLTKVTVASGAILQGGTFKLNDMAKYLVEDFSDDNTGMLINQGMISAALPNGSDTVLKIEGIVKSNGGTFGFISDGNNVGTIEITNGTIDGDVILAVNPNGTYLPGDEYTVGSLVTVDGDPIEYNKAIDYKSGMLTGAFDEEISTLSFKAENNTNSTDVAVNSAYNEMYNLKEAVDKADDIAAQKQMTKLINLPIPEATKALKAIKGQQTANASVVMQQSNLVHNALGMRLGQVNRAKAVRVNVPIKQLTEGEAINIPMDITLQPEYEMWAKISRNKGAINANSDYKTDAYSIGWDKQVGKDWRFGFFGNYAKGKFEADTIHNSIEDYRLGVYGGYNKGAAEAMVYADYGWGKNKLSRGLTNGFGTTNAKYNSNVMEIGAEYKYDLQHDKNKAWHVAPYGALQVNRYNQKAYEESGAAPFNKNVDKLNNTYAGLEAGVDLERRFANGSAYGMRLGYHRGLTGVEPKLNYHYAADPEHRYTNYGEGDKNKLVFKLNGQMQTAPNWSISGEAGYERGKKGHGYSGEITLKYTW